MTNRQPAPKLTGRQRRVRYAARKVMVAGGVVGVLIVLGLADRLGLFGRRRPGDVDMYDGKTFEVVRVVDGDTIDLAVEDPQSGRACTRVRLWGVDTPEVVKPDAPVEYYGPQASRFTKAAVLGKKVKLQLDPLSTRGKYGRVLAYVFCPDGKMLNRILIEQGYGYADRRFDHRYKGEFTGLERRAKKARRGLWNDARTAPPD